MPADSGIPTFDIPRRRRPVWVALVLLLPALLVYLNFQKIFACPECFLYEDLGDGLKNYYTLAWYVDHDQGWWFSGMNYPYGEHVLYTDNQPVLALFLGWIDRHVTDMHGHVVGTLNILLLVGLYAGILLTYALLRRWSVGRWWALFSATAIILLSPQLWRFHGHFGLAWMCFFPGFFLLLDKTVRGPGKTWAWGLATGAAVVAMSLSHLYFLILCGFSGAVWIAAYAWFSRREKENRRPLWLAGFLAVLLPALMLLTLRRVTDPVTDRPIEPWGIDAHIVEVGTTFFPFFPPFDKVWTEILGREKPINERIAYFGLVGLLMLPAIIAFLFRRPPEESSDNRTYIRAGVLTAVLCWLMAAGIFYQNGFQWVWDLIPPLKQFRGLGRFGMPFTFLYLSAMSYLLWQLYQLLRQRAMHTVGAYLLSAIALVWGFESWMQFRAVRAPLFHANNWMSVRPDNYIPLLDAAGLKPDDFQAILEFPIVAIGNETMGVARGFWTQREVFHASMETGLPQVTYAMSRTSVSQGMDLVELISPPYWPKRRAEKFNDKPLLLVCEEEFVLPCERYWIDQATRIGSYQSITLYSLPVSVFRHWEDPTAGLSISLAGDYWNETFDSLPCDSAMSGEGAMVIRSAPQLAWTLIDTATTERPMEVSFWSRVDNLHGHVPVPRMKETNPEGQVTLNAGLHREHIDWSAAVGNWIEVRFPFTFKGQGHRYDLFIDDNGPVIDNLLIRPAADTIVLERDGVRFFNNLPVIPLP